MSEFFNKKPMELLEIEQVVNELMEDLSHPLNNKRHPYHRDCVQAFNDLMAHADTIRQHWASH
ncbi:hypothetical protein [Methylomonas fluvii]|uniref:Uncharacterized protein n=1 Tax=Methylomonas fluvii TaxID=1854564 RepID=A0ABR9DEH7_9GAMM|nr:hypothetical protein [Methylomonas fluvii]MBD9361505.1 hypothetical protein [Methylomonas fluvii]